jgi:hypothetical protein
MAFAVTLVYSEALCGTCIFQILDIPTEDRLRRGRKLLSRLGLVPAAWLPPQHNNTVKQEYGAPGVMSK